ncbi:MAG: winged helix-turn-helix transcriptional regulator [Alphaproteobacteria bacterium]|nr:winged helix-turn-helix transcriptional regulator [Alphaproteobacteria bacterium]MBV9370338.1 winged helix-turn-helix transcriptional regulator [Alphaproteobacteria bacterium]MBV9902005.1 winged helix-turn-helix transcriptional regulator [Alphaproteobacteria bacterium]
MASTVRDEAPSGLSGVRYMAQPAVLILTDSEAGRERWRRVAKIAGCRVCDSAELAGGGERLDLQVGADAVLVEVTRDPGEALEPILARLDAAAKSGRHGGVIAAPAALIDRIAAGSLDSALHHLVDPSDLECVAALAMAATRHPPRLHDVGKSAATARLQQLSEEVGRVATILAVLSEDESAARALVGGGDTGEAGEAAGEPLDASTIRAMIRVRRLRDHFFLPELFADPAWDMLLDLMAARIERRRVAVSSLCIAAAVPATTALRWIKSLCDQKVFVRVADPEDGRRVFIELADRTAAALESYVKAAQRISPLVV